MATITPPQRLGRAEPIASTAAGASRSDDVAAAVFSTWVVIGLFVDGWAHNAGKPETFWTPWHGVLYSGFVTAMAWFALSADRARRRGTLVRPDPFVLAGFGLFAAGGVADMAWHSAFGVEADLEALLSPSHLLLMVAGLMLVTAPVRSALAGGEPARTWRAFAPAAVGLTLTVAVVAFFTQFASVLHVETHDVFAAAASDRLQVIGIVGVLLPSALLTGAVLWTSARWPVPPRGTFTLVFGGTALLMSVLDGFDQVALVLPVAAGGAVADALVARRAPAWLVGTVVPVVTWVGWFAAYDAVRGLGWPAELPAGTVVVAAVTGYGLGLLARRPSSARLLGERRVPA